MLNTKAFDLIAEPNKLETLFIMESPYIEELASGLPCSGSTGKRMSGRLFNNNEIALGKLIHDKTPIALQYGIMNSFPFALGLASQLPPEHQVFTKIKNIPWVGGKTTRASFYNEHLKTLNNIGDIEEQTHFKQRLTEYIQRCPNLKKLIFCGYIAQAMYMYAFKKDFLPYNKLTELPTKSGRPLFALFVNHPSEKNKEWDLKREII